jgi:hypothetical protein
MLFHWDTFRATHSILLLLNAAYMDRHVVPLYRMVGSECVPVEQGIYLSMHAALRSKSIEWLALNVSQSINYILLLLNAACMDRHVDRLGHIQSQLFYTLTP